MRRIKEQLTQIKGAEDARVGMEVVEPDGTYIGQIDIVNTDNNTVTLHTGEEIKGSFYVSESKKDKEKSIQEETEEKIEEQQEEPAVLVDGAHGIYIPQIFVDEYLNLARAMKLSQEDIDILRAGPDHEWYLETWDDVLNEVVPYHGKDYYLVYGPGGDLLMVDEDYDEFDDFYESKKKAKIKEAKYRVGDLSDGDKILLTSGQKVTVMDTPSSDNASFSVSPTGKDGDSFYIRLYDVKDVIETSDWF